MNEMVIRSLVSSEPGCGVNSYATSGQLCIMYFRKPRLEINRAWPVIQHHPSHEIPVIQRPCRIQSELESPNNKGVYGYLSVLIE